MRRKLLIGNWKMNKTRREALGFLERSRGLASFAASHGVDVGIAPSYLSLDLLLAAGEGMIVAAQNCHFRKSGAFTGEISIPMLLELGVKWCIVGHSERRACFNETDGSCNLKILALLAGGMAPIYCVGESEAEFDAGKTEEVLRREIREGLKGVKADDAARLVIAYEPIWAIGTGKSASPEIAERSIGFIRSLLAELFGADAAAKIRILYGGSVKPGNFRPYLLEKDIDGALVGGASLDPADFRKLVEIAVE